MKLNKNLESAGFVHVSREEILAKQLPIAGETVSPTPGGRSLYQEMQFQYTPEEGLAAAPANSGDKRPDRVRFVFFILL